ncbi:serine hydrolase domain-containing protein [Streptomyces sp. NPDC060020]|uniref:serine hydrolase domain-containing protein n=1 Tax=Streptomyces sp. NPDC060020 TaxID=3347038 RepID=UPI003699B0AD
MPHRTIRAMGFALLLAVCAGAGGVVAPAPARLGSATTGDATLAARAREAAGNGLGHRGIEVAFVDKGKMTFAGLGDSGNPAHPAVDESTVFEAGSIGKPMTGMLLADLEDRKLLDLGTPLERLLPERSFSDPLIGQSTLTDLATHRAGLEKMPDDLGMMRRNLSLMLLGEDPYRGLGEDDVLSAAESASAGTPGTYRYSNLGMALAGYTAAHRAGQPFPELLSARLLGPLGMRDSRVMAAGDPLPPRAAEGRQATGPAVDHWFASGYTPAGDIWTTGRDLGVFLRSVIAKTAPGARAAIPTHEAERGGRTGLGWFTSTIGGREITWQNGATGGFTSYMAFDGAAERGVVVLGNTDRSVDAIGERLLGLPPTVHPTGSRTPALVTALASLGAPVPLLVAWLRPSDAGRRRRSGLVCVHALFGAAALALTWRRGSWLSIPPELWAVGSAVLLWAFLLGVAGTGPRPPAEQPPPQPARTGPLVRTVALWTGCLVVLLAAQL